MDIIESSYSENNNSEGKEFRTDKISKKEKVLQKLLESEYNCRISIINSNQIEGSNIFSITAEYFDEDIENCVPKSKVKSKEQKFEIFYISKSQAR